MNIISDKIRSELVRALIHADKQQAIDIIEKNNVDVNSLTNANRQRTILHDAINVLSNHDSDNQIAMVDYLLSKGADPNVKTTEGYNCLHLSVEYHNLSRISLMLILKGNVDINATDNHGGNAIFTAIREYRLTWRPEQSVHRQLRFQIIEELLKRGANLDLPNNHNVKPRDWIDKISKDDKLHELIQRYDRNPI